MGSNLRNVLLALATRRAWAGLIAVHLAVFALASVIGWQHADEEFPATRVLASADTFRLIVQQNAPAIAFLVASSFCSCGLAGLVVHAGNGYLFGRGARQFGLWWRVWYAPVELLAFAIGSTGSAR